MFNYNENITLETLKMNGYITNYKEYKKGKGAPDAIDLDGSTITYIECKTDGCGLSYEQIRFLYNKINKGYRVFIATYFLEKSLIILEEYKLNSENHPMLIHIKDFNVIDSIKKKFNNKNIERQKIMKYEITKKVTKIGTGAHILLPVSLVGKYVEVYYSEEK